MVVAFLSHKKELLLLILQIKSINLIKNFLITVIHNKILSLFGGVFYFKLIYYQLPKLIYNIQIHS